ncbi:thioesterase [Dickeya oryzae]|uniref:thioesterase II family protein n=1 Tax=Dickeya oryzae TaxID=1240404 RepID=UPI001AECAE85|nr:alpha/beta fold hydrolase [Dickeya oryzae]MBP2845669.1 thioesterase [Dickeya oryzae]
MENRTFLNSFPMDSVPKPTVLCFPHAGGSSEDYLKWQEYLNSYATLKAICLPGTGRLFAEKYPSSIDFLTTKIANDIDCSGIGEYYLFGHSMGAILAYEVALKVKKPAKGLIVSSSAAPAFVPSPRILKMTAMSDKDFSREIIFFNGIEENLATSEEFIKIFIKKIRKDFELISKYKYQPKNILSIPIYSVVGDRDPHVSIDAIEQWKLFTERNYKKYIVPGDHFYFNDNPTSIASVIKGCVNQESNNESYQSLII